MVKQIPSDKINLKLIYYNCGDKTKEFLVPSTYTALDVSNYVYANWPDEWNAHKVDKANILRLIYQGKFLHELCTLNSINIKCGRTTVMHLIPRERLPEPNVDDTKKDKSNSNDETLLSNSGGSSSRNNTNEPVCCACILL